MEFTLNEIGRVKSPYTEKFGVPRQALLTQARGTVQLNPEPRYQQAIRGLEQFSHIWIVFIFDRNMTKPWHPLIETPAIDRREKVGVFATRSPDRPNSVGMSAVKLEQIDLHSPGGIEIHVSGLDLLDGTPVLDIKPYVPYADCIPDANSGWLTQVPKRYPVAFHKDSEAQLLKLQIRYAFDLRTFITEMVELDPRPTSQRRAVPMGEPGSLGSLYSFRVLDLDIHWQIDASGPTVLRIEDLAQAVEPK